MITGYVIKRSDTDFVVKCDSHGIGGYNVVPKEIAKDCEYTLEEVQDYIQKNPEMLLDLEVIESEKSRIAEIATLKTYLTETDYIYPKCLELGLDVNIEYADVVSQRKSARTRIQELDV